MTGLWRWTVLIVAIVSVGLALLREQNRSSDLDATESSTSINLTTTTEPLGNPTPAPEWCLELSTIDDSTPLNDVAMKYLSAGLVAGGAIERDLTAAALAMTGDQTESAASAGSRPQSPTTISMRRADMSMKIHCFAPVNSSKNTANESHCKQPLP